MLLDITGQEMPASFRSQKPSKKADRTASRAIRISANPGVAPRCLIPLDAYNHARRLKTLRGLTPYEHILQVWTKEPDRFRLDPSHHIPGPYT
jgi:hypothetical protein